MNRPRRQGDDVFSVNFGGRGGTLPAIILQREKKVSYFGALPGGVRMRQAGNRELFAYWRRLKGERSAPERNDVDPGAIRAILSDVFILEFDCAAGLPIRVAGVRTNGLFGRELRATPFLDLWRLSDRADIIDLVEATVNEAQPMVIAGIGRAADHAPIGVEVLLLPLRHHGDTHSRLLGAFSPASVPRWFGLDEVIEVEYLTSRVLFDTSVDNTERYDTRYAVPSYSIDAAMNRRKQFYVISSNL